MSFVIINVIFNLIINVIMVLEAYNISSVTLFFCIFYLEEQFTGGLS